LYWLTIVLISSPLQTTPCRQRALPGKTDTTKTAVGLHLVPGLVELEALTHCWMSTHHNRVARQWLHRASWRRISLSMVSWLAPPSLGHEPTIGAACLLGWLALVADASALLDMASAGYGRDLVAVSFARPYRSHYHATSVVKFYHQQLQRMSPIDWLGCSWRLTSKAAAGRWKLISVGCISA
jgi:hypothetical protein